MTSTKLGMEIASWTARQRRTAKAMPLHTKYPDEKTLVIITALWSLFDGPTSSIPNKSKACHVESLLTASRFNITGTCSARRPMHQTPLTFGIRDMAVSMSLTKLT